MAENEIKRVITIEGSESLNTLNSLNTRIKELRGSMRDLDIVSEEYREVSEEVTRLENVKRNAMRGTTAAVEGSYNAYSKELSILQQHRKTLHEESEEYKEITRRVGELQEKLKSMDAEVGIYNRNVGNYASAFDGLQGSVNGVVAKLPSLNGGLASFAQGMNEALPRLIESVQGYREMAAQAGQSTNVIGALGNALFSWNTVISIAVTLIAKYSDKIIEWVSNLGKSKKEIGATERAMRELNKTIEESGLGIGDEIYKLKELQRAWIELGDSLESRKKFIEDNKSAFDELGVSVQNVADADRLFIEQTDAYITALKARAQAAAAQKLAEEEFEKAMRASVTASRISQDMVKGIAEGTLISPDNQFQMSLYNANPLLLGKSYNKAVKEWESMMGNLKAEKEKEKESNELANTYFDLAQKYQKEAEETLKRAGIKGPGGSSTSSSAKAATTTVNPYDTFASDASLQATLDARTKMLSASAEERVRIELELSKELALIEEFRLTKEIEDLQSQLDTETLTAEKRLDIERQLTESKIALAEQQLATEKIYEDERKALRDKADKEEAERVKKELEREKLVKDAKAQSVTSVSKALSAIADLGEEDAKWQKGLRKASIVMDTFQASMSGWKTAQTLPAPMNAIVGGANIAASVAMGAKQLQALNNTAIDGSNASLSGAQSAPVVASTTPASYIRNLQGDAEMTEINKDVRVYVVESDITDAQNVAKARVQSASF